MNNYPMPELLAPGGSAEAAEAAIAAGADAIYFGAQQFSARARAKNLDSGEVRETLSLCRAHGVRGYAALNIRIRDRELSQALALGEELLSLGADGLIVADIGLSAALRHRFPEAPLHASTQITGTTAADARILRDAGFKRMVCPRELSLQEIASLVKDSPIGIEAFVHGAHCVSVSGQCTMSQVMGGRSGNRGDCAGPCRLPFCAAFPKEGRGKKGAFDLSLKDMCLATHLNSLRAAGVESLKIEGRLKGADYTFGVVSVYRRLLDGGRDGGPEDVAELRELFSRDGFSDGYLKRRYSNMLGVRGERASEGGPAPKGAVIHPEKVALRGEFSLVTGRAASLTLTSPDRSVTVTGEEPIPAEGRAPSEESFVKSLSRLGQTPFFLESCRVEHDGIATASAAAINSLRRRGVEELLAPFPIIVNDVAEVEETGNAVPPERVVRCAVIGEKAQFTAAVERYFHRIYVPLYDYLEWGHERGLGLSLPEVMYEADMGAVARALEAARQGGEPVLVHGMGELGLALEAGCEAHCSHRFAVHNSRSFRELIRMGAASVTLSPEIPLGAGQDMSPHGAVGAVIGGRLPLMLCRRCALSDGGRRCPHGRVGGYDGRVKEDLCRGSLVDRTGTAFPLIGDRSCMNTVYNSVPCGCALSERELLGRGIGITYHIFSDETGHGADAAVALLEAGKLPERYRGVR